MRMTSPRGMCARYRLPSGHFLDIRNQVKIGEYSVTDVRVYDLDGMTVVLALDPDQAKALAQKILEKTP